MLSIFLNVWEYFGATLHIIYRIYIGMYMNTQYIKSQIKNHAYTAVENLLPAVIDQQVLYPARTFCL